MKPLLETLTAGAGYLEKRGVEEARLNMEHLLAHVLRCRRLDLYLRFNESVPEPELAKLRDLTRRRAEGEPLQHLLGTVDFLGHELVSDHRALVPRPETEYLVDYLLREYAAGRFGSPRPGRFLDMAAGSGCIGLTLAAAWAPHGAAAVLADISEDALDLARLNASRLRLDTVQFLRSDLFEKVTGAFDLIVANLPYIPSSEIPALSREVRRDPLLALDGGPDGMAITQRFLSDALPHLAPGALIALELGESQPPLVAGFAQTLGYQDLLTLPDLAGIERFLLARAPVSPDSPSQPEI